ncbi:hypothetical protein AXG89_26720 (plasmid) [Burkholderia sp. PAMC 26561]|nr:hypothetical protein AXG89_25970 [Burkholderia sp. PAMC 26561]AME27516.1 hypothetical protein AXG89_26720 [Burkholderia sp. PAMC 26561]
MPESMSAAFADAITWAAASVSCTVPLDNDLTVFNYQLAKARSRNILAQHANDLEMKKMQRAAKLRQS